jgi:carboxyl-terminal processing protease
LKKASSERVKQSAAFKLIDSEAKELKAKKDDTKYNLKIDKYRAELKQLREQNKKYDSLKQEIKGFTTDIVFVDKESMKADTVKLNKEIKWTKNIAKDNYINEASNILNDMK